MKEYQSLSHTRWDCKYPSESRLKFFFACRHRRENQLVRFSMRPPNESHCSEALGKLGFRKQCDLDQTAGQKFPRLSSRPWADHLVYFMIQGLQLAKKFVRVSNLRFDRVAQKKTMKPYFFVKLRFVFLLVRLIRKISK